MTNKLWLIDYESSQWCGGQSYVVVHAETANEALWKAEPHMEEAMRELFADEYAEHALDEDGMENELDDECAYAVNSIEQFDETHEQWEFFKNPSQAIYYPVIE